MTKQLSKFAVFCVAWSIAFFAVLDWALQDEEQRWPYIWAAAITYGLGFGLSGFLFGRLDDQKNVRYDLRLRYSLTSTILSFVVGAFYIALFNPSSWLMLVIYVAIALVFTVPHFMASKKSIKGMDKKELFK